MPPFPLWFNPPWSCDNHSGDTSSLTQASLELSNLHEHILMRIPNIKRLRETFPKSLPLTLLHFSEITAIGNFDLVSRHKGKPCEVMGWGGNTVSILWAWLNIDSACWQLVRDTVLSNSFRQLARDPTASWAKLCFPMTEVKRVGFKVQMEVSTSWSSVKFKTRAGHDVKSHSFGRHYMNCNRLACTAGNGSVLGFIKPKTTSHNSHSDLQPSLPSQEYQ